MDKAREGAQEHGGGKEQREGSKQFGSRNKKQMYIKLKSQMEFYFSVSNINKDKFVAKKLQEDPQIPISTFLSFNKIKEILSAFMIPEEKQQHELAKSLLTSEILELTEDRTKVYLKNDLPKKSQQEIDELTIYVEQIPLSSTHESLKNIFSKYGRVNYISLPRYKKSGQIKQFCFIEFDDAASVQNCLQGFKKFDALLHQTKPECLLSIKTFEKDDVIANQEPQQQEDESAKKINDDDDDSEQPPPAKKQKLDGVNEEEEEGEGDDSMEEGEKSNNDETNETPEKTGADDDTEKKKKKLRKHKRNHSKKKLIDERVMAMKVMKKIEWKKLRNTYLTLERQKAKEIKKILRESYNKRNESKNQPLLTTSKASPKISFYGSPDHFNEHTNESAFESQQASNASNNFTPGCIVNIKFREPCADCKDFKKELKQFPCVQYVDIPEGGTQCFIRVDVSQAAHELVNHYSSCEYETEILKDDAEREYWKKIFENREKKKKSKREAVAEKPTLEKRKRRRGREKLAIKIGKVTQSNQIIRFNEFEDHAECV